MTAKTASHGLEDMDCTFQVSCHSLIYSRYCHTHHTWEKGKDTLATRRREKQLTPTFFGVLYSGRWCLHLTVVLGKLSLREAGWLTAWWDSKTCPPSLCGATFQLQRNTSAVPSSHFGQFTSPLYLFIFINIKVILTLGFWSLLFC